MRPVVVHAIHYSLVFGGSILIAGQFNRFVESKRCEIQTVVDQYVNGLGGPKALKKLEAGITPENVANREVILKTHRKFVNSATSFWNSPSVRVLRWTGVLEQTKNNLSGLVVGSCFSTMPLRAHEIASLDPFHPEGSKFMKEVARGVPGEEESRLAFTAVFAKGNSTDSVGRAIKVFLPSIPRKALDTKAASVYAGVDEEPLDSTGRWIVGYFKNLPPVD